MIWEVGGEISRLSASIETPESQESYYIRALNNPLQFIIK